MNVSHLFTRAVLVVAFSATLSSTLAAPRPAALQSVPFAAKSGSGDRMHFTAIPAVDSGLVVQNPYDDPAMWGTHYTEFQGGAIGSGIAAGDVDGDGLVDLYVVNKTRPNQLFKQTAPFKFTDITAAAGVAGPTGAWKTGASFADVNNDGHLDLYVCRFNAPNLLYLNDGQGHFTEAAVRAGVALVSGSVVGTFEDYDRDGDLDLFVVTNVQDMNRSPNGEPDYLYRNRGDGTFEDVTARAGIAADPGRGHSATWFDANADGWPDLYVGNDFVASDHFYRNNGDGTFTDILPAAVAHTTWFSMGSDSADINNDALPDLLVAEMAATTHYKAKVFMGEMGGLVNDMDKLVTPQYMNNAVFLNSGTDRFWEIAKLTGLGKTDWSWSVRFEDLDNDGWVDLHVTNGMVRPFIDSDMLNTIKKLPSTREAIALVKSRPPQRETNLAFRNDGNLHFSATQAEWGLDHTGVSFGSTFADFDNDGDLDLAYVNFEDNVSLYRNDSPGGHRLVVALRGTTSNRFGVGAQVFARTAAGTQVRKVTVVRGALSSSEPVVHFGLGDSTTVDELEVRWPSGQMQKFTNLAADARYTITEPSRNPQPPAAVPGRPLHHGLFTEQAPERGIDFVNTERVYNDMARPGQSLLPNRMNTLGGGIAWGDVNRDGFADLFFAGAAGKGSTLYLNDGRGHFAPAASQPWQANPDFEAMSAAFLDVNRDGAVDLVVVAGSVESNKGSDLLRSRLYLNDGRGGFTAAPAGQLPVPASSSAVVSTADFDRDGDLDVFIGGRVVPGEYPTTPESVLLENRDGALVDVTDQVGPALRRAGMVTAALWSDVDEDGFVDLLLAGEWMTLRLFRNDTRGALVETTEAAQLNTAAGWWNSLIAADVNRDGHMDYVAGNVGLNTKYHASADHPVSIHYVDIEGNGNFEVIESEYEGDKLFPVRGRSCSSRAMPSLKEKFPTFHDWGSAILPEIYPEDKMAKAFRVTATELASGVFLNDGHGRFTFQALPRLVQASPVYGIAAQDFNGDGALDLVLGQNFHGPQVETGRFDGGLSLMLAGDGRGGFAPVTPQASGIAITGEARSIAVADWNRDGWPDLVITRVNERALALAHRGHPKTQSVAIKLTGPAGNPDALGARVIARYKDGSAQAVDLAAGTGHLAQSEALAFFTYTKERAPASLEVRWPDGKQTSHKFKAGKPRVTLSQ